MPRQPVVSPVTRGLEVRRAEHLIPEGSYIEMANADLQAAGAVGIRAGYGEVVPPATGSGLPYAIMYRDDELVICKDERLYSLQPDRSWRDVGYANLGRLRTRQFAGQSTGQTLPDIDVMGDTLLVVWAESTSNSPDVSGSIYFAGYDLESLGLITELVEISTTGANPYVRAADTFAWITWRDVATSNFKSVYWEPGASEPANTGVPVIIDGRANLINQFSLDRGQGDTIVTVTASFTAAPTLRAQEWDRTSVQQTQDIAAPSGDPNSVEIIRLTQSATHSYFLINTDSGVFARARFLDSDLSVSATVDYVRAGSGGAVYAAERSPSVVTASLSAVGVFDNETDYVDFDSSAASLENRIYRHRGSGRARLIRGRLLWPVVILTDFPNSYNTSQNYIMYDAHAGAVAGMMVGTEVGYGVTNSHESTTNMVLLGDRLLYATPSLPGSVRATASIPSANPGNRLLLHEAIFADTPVPNALRNGAVHMPSAGMARIYDGQTSCELSFFEAPVVESTVQVAGSILAGTYVWSFQWAWEDRQGQLYKSAPTLYTEVVAANRQVDFTITSAQHTERDNVFLRVGRTLAGSSDPFYRVDSISSPTFNDKNTPSISFSDNIPDATLQNNQIVEDAGTSPNLPNSPTPITDFVRFDEGRMWGGDPRRQNIVRFSKPLRDAVGVEMSPSQAVELDGFRRAVGVAAQDGVLHGFTRDTVHFWNGQGPDLAGNGSYPAPRRMPFETGAESQSGILSKIPGGIMYVSSDGPRYVTRGRGGAIPVPQVNEAWTYLGQVTTAAVYRSDIRQIVLYDDGPDVDPAGIEQKRMTIRIHPEDGRATHDTGHQARDAATSLSRGSAFIRIDGTICIHDQSNTDGGDPVNLYVVTRWMRVERGTLTPEQELGLINIVGVHLGPHLLRVRLAKNYDHTIVMDAPGALVDPSRDGVRDVPVVYSDTSGDQYISRVQTVGSRIYSVAVAVNTEIATPVSDGLSGMALVAIETGWDVSPTESIFAMLDPRRVY